MFFRSKKDHLSELVGYAGFFLGPDLQAEGSVEGDDDVFIDCQFKGDINTPGALEIGKNANFEGTIKARSVIVEGNVKATIDAVDEISVASCAEITGQLKALRIGIENGAAVQAKLNSGGDK